MADGKESKFIAGYNLAPEEVTKKYDKKEYAILGLSILIGAIIELFF